MYNTRAIKVYYSQSTNKGHVVENNKQRWRRPLEEHRSGGERNHTSILFDFSAINLDEDFNHNCQHQRWWFMTFGRRFFSLTTNVWLTIASPTRKTQSKISLWAHVVHVLSQRSLLLKDMTNSNSNSNIITSPRQTNSIS